MNDTLIVLGRGLFLKSTKSISKEGNRVSIVKHNEFDKIRGQEFKSISFIGEVASSDRDMFLVYLR